MISVLGDDDVRDQRFGRQAAFDQAFRRWRLGDLALAGPTGILGPAGDDHLELRWHYVEPPLSSPIRCLSRPQHAQVLSSTSRTTSSRGR
jgi:hypothetical protein